jgi:hypothetical protein
VTYHLFMVAVFLCTIWLLFERRRSRVLALVLGIPAIAGSLSSYAFAGVPGTARSLFFHLIPTFFIGYAILTILAGIFRDRRFSLDGVMGALGGYLLIGLAFGHLYCLAEALHPDSFYLAGRLGPLPAGPEQRHSLLTYYSLVTLTTLGYGDITPQSVPSRTLAWLEAVVGQFYVAVIIAGLVGLRVSTAILDLQSRPPGANPS